MSFEIVDVDKIYFPRTREYFEEVLTSYSIRNYRSAVVMLYSVAICDLLYKLQELKDMYNDTVATQILSDVEKERKKKDGSHSKWEWSLVDQIYQETKLLDDSSHINLNNLYSYRNLSAHPAMNENFDLISPSQEMTIALIKNTYNDILVKPPIFISNVVDLMTEDLAEKAAIYKDSPNDLHQYLTSRYFSRMPDSMKKQVVKAFWKFCFCRPEDDDCKKNLHINRMALECLFDDFETEAIVEISSNTNQFNVASDETCIINLIVLLSHHPKLFSALNDDVKMHINKFLSENLAGRLLAWFKFPSLKEHMEYLVEDFSFDGLQPELIRRFYKYYNDRGEKELALYFLIEYYGNSTSYDAADERFSRAIEPFLHDMNADDFLHLIKVSCLNPQIYDRRCCRSANTQIVKTAKKVLSKDFDYSEHELFRFDKSVLEDGQEERS